MRLAERLSEPRALAPPRRSLQERLDDRLNPLMIKEVRQSFRSGTLRVTAVLALSIPLLMFLGFTTRVLMEAPGASRSGQNYFMIVGFTLMVVTWLLLPARAGQLFWSEIRTRTIDLIWLTHLSPWQLAIGRLQASVLQTLLLFALCAPYCAAATVMGGIDMPSVVITLALLFLGALLQCSVVLAATTTFAITPRLARVAALLAALALLFNFSMCFFAGVDRALVPSDWPYFVWFGALIAGAILLTLRLSADMLTRGSGRSYALSKLALAVFLALLLLPALLPAILDRGSPNSRDNTLWLASFVLYFFVLCFSAAQPRAGRRSIALYPLRDGYAPSFAYAALGSTAIAALALWRGVPVTAAYVYFTYALFFSALARLRCSFEPGPFSPERYLLYVILLVVADMTLSSALSDSWLAETPALLAFLPVSQLMRSSLQPHPLWYGLPIAIGLASSSWAELRFARRAHG
jgi:hypothetical protein